MKYDEILDAQGLYCPEPVMMLHAKIKKIAPGEVLKVVATDPSTTRDITKFCRFLGHDLLEHNEREGVYCFWIQKKEA